MFSYTDLDKEKIIKGYFTSLEPLKLRLFPPKQKKQFIVLNLILTKIDNCKKYTEKELNDILQDIYPDYVTLRRGLIDYQLMERTRDCTFYWVKKTKAVIFDLDGVIVTTDEFHYRAWKTIADKENLQFNREMNHLLRGVSRRESLEIILKKNNINYSEDKIKELLNEKNDVYKASLNELNHDSLLPNVEELLDFLKKHGIKVAIGSSSRNAKFILEKIGLIDAFDAISDGTNITHSKPHPEVFLHAANQLGIAPENCYVVEDASAGIVSAKRANMTAIAIGTFAANGQEDFHVKNLLEIINIV